MIKREQKSEGAPEWVLTYGDMMSLLLCFFILLQAFSELKKEDLYQEVVRSIQEAFGYDGGIGRVPSQTPPEVANVIRMRAVAAENFELTRGDSHDEGQEGRRTTVHDVRDGLEFRLGGAAAFEEGKAELLPEVIPDLTRIAGILRGYNNKIEIRGHTSSVPLPADSPFDDQMDLSYARARAVAGFFEQRGIDARCVRIVAAGDTEPQVARAYEREDWARNSRVEIRVLESLVPEFQPQRDADPAAAP